MEQPPSRLGAPIQERISFPPHPKTITKAGDYEYFAAQGHHPFPYALAELVDNSLKAVQHLCRGYGSTTNSTAGQQAKIDITCVVQQDDQGEWQGMICVEDNGVGMSKQELTEWAVMNLTMEDRQQGKKSSGSDVSSRSHVPDGVGKFLTGDLSYFGVGSKAAAFYLGSVVKVVTKTADSPHVLELSISAQELEERYREGQPVYEETLITRDPGDISTLKTFEKSFSCTCQWVEAEAAAVQESFTRVMMGELKPQIIDILVDVERGQQVIRELAHLYHYYLHGEQGNIEEPQPQPQKDWRVPTVQVRLVHGEKQLYCRDLKEVDDDVETKYLRAQKGDFNFQLKVVGRGDVEGRLYYFPYCNDHETVPLEDHPLARQPLVTYNLTQAQHNTQATQRPAITQQDMLADEDGENSGGAVSAALPTHLPLFETFWEGRLIPGGRVASLPFIESLRNRRSGAAKDKIPDEVFQRLRGMLFFDSSYMVTRNKLTFRDNLTQIMHTTSLEKGMDRRFRDWLIGCHQKLDMTVQYKNLALPHIQAREREKTELLTVFQSAVLWNREIGLGSKVRLVTKSNQKVIGDVQHFTVPKVVKKEGCYSQGRIAVQLLPAEAYGTDIIYQSVRRVEEGVVDDKALQEYIEGEKDKLPNNLQLEPLKLSHTLHLKAGTSISDSKVAVCNRLKQRLTKAQMMGVRQPLVVTQRLLYYGRTAAAAPAAQDAEVARASKRSRKGKSGRLGRAAAAEGTARDVSFVEEVSCIVNSTPGVNDSATQADKDAFYFKRTPKLGRAGRYVLQYSVSAQTVPDGWALESTTEIIVEPGAAAAFDVQGEGRALLMDGGGVMLGEPCPELKVVLKDVFDNTLDVGSEMDLGLELSLEGQGGAHDDEAQQLMATAEQEVNYEENHILLKNLRIQPRYSTATGGLTIFAPASQHTPTSVQGAQAYGSQQHCFQASVKLKVGRPALSPATLKIDIRPGPPAAIALLEPHAWQLGDSEDVVLTQQATWRRVEVDSGQKLPAVTVVCYDAWGNVTCPSPSLKMSIVSNCELAAINTTAFEVGSNGHTTITGVIIGHATAPGSRDGTLQLSVKCDPNRPAAKAALETTLPAAPISLPISVTCAPQPARLAISWNDNLLPIKEQLDESSEEVVVVHELEAVVGSLLGGLSVVVVDDVDQVVEEAVQGRMQWAWSESNKPVKATLGPNPYCLPEIATSTEAKTYDYWIQFMGPKSRRLVLEARLLVTLVPDAPESWSLRLCPTFVSEGMTSEMLEEGHVRCGLPFMVEVEALDKHNNRCPGGFVGNLPKPRLQLESAGMLNYCSDQWEEGWMESQGSEEVYCIKMRMWGEVGSVSLTIQDNEVESGGSAIKGDTIGLELKPGPLAELEIDGSSRVESDSIALLPPLVVRAVDAYRNTVDNEDLQVMVSSQAVRCDGDGDDVVEISGGPKGGNKAKLVRGVATFSGLRVCGPGKSGDYALQAELLKASTQVSPVAFILSLSPVSVVSSLTLCEPMQAGDIRVGQEWAMQVVVQSDGDVGAPRDVIIQGTTLKLQPAGGGRSDAVVARLSEDSSIEDRDVTSISRTVTFRVPALTVAGSYHVTAEFKEQRKSVLELLGSRATSLRSSSLSITAAPGPPAAMSLESDIAADTITVTNGPVESSRVLLRAASLQLRDEQDNAVHMEGMTVRMVLARVDGDDGADGAELPDMICTAGTEVTTNEDGVSFFGDVSLVEGTGCLPQDSRSHDSHALHCMLLVEVSVDRGSPNGDDVMGSPTWQRMWSCDVMFADDAAKWSTISSLNEKHSNLIQRQHELQEKKDTLQEEVDQAQQAVQAATEAVRKLQVDLHPDPPTTSSDARAMLQAAQGRVSKLAGRTVVPALYGKRGNQMKNAVDYCLASGEGVVGVFAQLLTVDDEALCRVLSTVYRQMLMLVVVEQKDVMTRLKSALIKQKMPASPDMLAMSHAVQYRGQTGGSLPSSASDSAVLFTRRACEGSDPILPLPLPHLRATGRGAQNAGGIEWPQGCLGYAFNLVRPAVPGHRAALLYNNLGTTLVFETLESAQAYREHCTQELHIGAPDIVTLDFNRVSSKGITSGSNFRVLELDRMDARFGLTPPTQSVEYLEAFRTVEAVQQLLPVLETLAEAEQQLSDVQHAANDTEGQLSSELQEVEAQLADIADELQQITGTDGVVGGTQAGRRRKAGASQRDAMQRKKRRRR